MRTMGLLVQFSNLERVAPAADYIVECFVPSRGGGNLWARKLRERVEEDPVCPSCCKVEGDSCCYDSKISHPLEHRNVHFHYRMN
jgi:hypothetical protein